MKLIDELEKIESDFRIRLSSIDPEDITDELINRFRAAKKFCRHFHIPLQSGDDYILKRMDWHYSSSYIMVGFPGEPEDNFENTLKITKEISPLRIHIFPYSKRDGTGAAKFDSMPAAHIVQERIKRLRMLQAQTSYNFRRNFIGKDLRVLVETRRDRNLGLLTGYSDNYIKVIFEGPGELMRRLIHVKILNVTYDFTFGKQDGD